MVNVPSLFVTVDPVNVGLPRFPSIQLIPARALVAQSVNPASASEAQAARHRARDRDLRFPEPEVFSGHRMRPDELDDFIMIFIWGLTGSLFVFRSVTEDSA